MLRKGLLRCARNDESGCHCEERSPEAISEGLTVQARNYYIYIMTNQGNRVLYTGVTNDLKRRAYEHREKLVGGFTRRYSIGKLVYYEAFDDPGNAIYRGKQIKGGSRQKKVGLVSAMNPEWRDLYEEL